MTSTSPSETQDILETEAPYVSVDQSSLWLTAGWHDMRRNLQLSLGYGVIFVIISYALTIGLIQAGLGSLILPLASGFLLVGPLAAVGLYEISRRQETGEVINIAAIFKAVNKTLPQLSGVGLALMFVLFAWIELALIIFAVFYDGAPPQVDRFISEILSAPQAPLFLLVGTAVGGVLAVIAFAISALSMPMILDRKTSAFMAMVTSVQIIRKNWRVMSGWAAMIALIIFVGMATFFIGLAIALPLIGHASWHAYKAMVPPSIPDNSNA